MSPDPEAGSDRASSDEALIARARQGDDQAFRVLVERYESVVAATIIGMVGPGGDADDLGQETFVRFYRALGSFRGEATVKTFLTRIAINVALTALKKRRRDEQRLVSRDAWEVPLDPAGDANADADARERSALVRGALRELSADHRAVVTLRLIEGHSTKETAALLSIPEGTVLSRLARALDVLKRTLHPLLDSR